ncbi:MAG: tRNA (N(6)-L-threonylcarbamoyladenosine(37)-C(2))-methylthiotransferase MtaB [Coriobacteriia bacterium]|nr:tRNA (N(6)-L-threonylcarbamoyladenosine(37)-C(2))-methylthiotransferase MtaB [Coriobacteriia bacterium]
MARYFIKTFGCKVNQVESDELAEKLAAMGAQSVDSALDADIVIVNTCTVTGEADRKVRKELRKLARFPQVAAVIVTGCSAVLLKDELEALDEKITALPTRDVIPAFMAEFSQVLPLVTFDDENISSSSSLRKRIRVPVKVQDGCEDFCSYCIVPFARGGCTSVPADQVIERIEMLVVTGTKEVILTGINLGNYQDQSGGDLAALLRRIQSETDIYRVRLSSIEPRHVSDELIQILAEGSLLCEHLHIPMQSGSDYVLGDMNRQYSAAEFKQLIERIRDAAPQTAISTDIIVGYPSEGDDDFEQTLELVRELNFAKIHVFRFSPREGTAAARLKPLNPRVVRQRAQALQELADLDALRHYDNLAGAMVEIIVEDIDLTAETFVGTTRQYLHLKLPLSMLDTCTREELQAGDIVKISLPARFVDAGE